MSHQSLPTHIRVISPDQAALSFPGQQDTLMRLDVNPNEMGLAAFTRYLLSLNRPSRPEPASFEVLKGEEIEECTICKVEVAAGESGTRLSCHHEYHSQCLGRWLKTCERQSTAYSCPLCRSPVVE